MARSSSVTGAGRGLGRAYAIDLAKHGAKVIVNDFGGSVSGEGHDDTPAQQVVNEIKALGGEAIADGGDVGSFEDCYKMVKLAIDTGAASMPSSPTPASSATSPSTT
ncbi:SDR family NAD(P)-dependent oxidoreductase [Tepidiforma flava]|uniref:SDR family NAD(P)-dependent oxidoreductase n=1 Tax=Tepidiforma flava TaxID=3004094 RepID=A0ABY7MA99_9CHLR|nr:SDR family NAD(P)-dependent oxidoreductase [Tepidiforma flava]WBL37491.1 SDR family NAD(P)-dependent oxidoreductase [Tepidiforma flava]